MFTVVKQQEKSLRVLAQNQNKKKAQKYLRLSHYKGLSDHWQKFNFFFFAKFISIRFSAPFLTLWCFRFWRRVYTKRMKVKFLLSSYVAALRVKMINHENCSKIPKYLNKIIILLYSTPGFEGPVTFTRLFVYRFSDKSSSVGRYRLRVNITISIWLSIYIMEDSWKYFLGNDWILKSTMCAVWRVQCCSKI